MEYSRNHKVDRALLIAGIVVAAVAFYLITNQYGSISF